MPGARLAPLARLLLVPFLLIGCAPVVVELPAEPERPSFELVAVNRMDRDAMISIKFEGPNVGGTGEGAVAACTSSTMSFGGVGNHLVVEVDGVQAWEGNLPANIANGVLVMRVDIAPDGEVTAGAPALFMRVPQVPPNPPGC